MMRPTLFSVCCCAAILGQAIAFAPCVPQQQQRVGATRLFEATTEVAVEPKELVKIFGRLAEKYIMLDDSGGMCCYSACSGTCINTILFIASLSLTQLNSTQL